jgi:cell shape-determining protein MreC
MPNSKTEDGPVTDEELEELEAENARLRLLLNERLKPNEDGSEN